MAIPFLSYQDGNNGIDGYLWLIYALLVFFAWGFQAFIMKKANNTMKAESIFFYMMITGILLAPIAWFMTDFSQNIKLSWFNIGITFSIQILNSIGALMLVYAFRYGKAIIVSPLTNAVAPVITVVLSLIIYPIIPHKMSITGMIMAIISIFLLAFEDE